MGALLLMFQVCATKTGVANRDCQQTCWGHHAFLMHCTVNGVSCCRGRCSESPSRVGSLKRSGADCGNQTGFMLQCRSRART